MSTTCNQYDGRVENCARLAGSRYHIGHLEFGLIDVAAQKSEAFRIAEAWAEREKYFGVTVYDRNAKFGSTQSWILNESGNWNALSVRRA